MPEQLIVGNWKMNLGPEAGLSAYRSLVAGLEQAQKKGREEGKGDSAKAQLWLAPSYLTLGTLLSQCTTSGNERADFKEDGRAIKLGAQNCHWEKSGAFTGEVSAEMLRELGADFVIIGHSERRALFAESEDTAAMRAQAAFEAGLTVVFCVGESKEQRARGETAEILKSQLRPLFKKLEAAKQHSLYLAYEPVWAIGTGQVATTEIIASTHLQIQEIWHDELGQNASLTCPAILYGGSVTPDNFAEISRVAGVSGALVGGASLDPQKLLDILKCAC
jgi:triosephosphate isomerase (TIM)